MATRKQHQIRRPRRRLATRYDVVTRCQTSPWQRKFAADRTTFRRPNFAVARQHTVAKQLAPVRQQRTVAKQHAVATHRIDTEQQTVTWQRFTVAKQRAVAK